MGGGCADFEFLIISVQGFHCIYSNFTLRNKEQEKVLKLSFQKNP